MHTRPITLLLTLFALALLGACSCGEETRCDADGCYVCDGVDCRPVDPPARQPCDGDFACSGQVCTSLGCVSACEDTADCSEDTVCRDGLCVHPKEEEPNLTPGTCVRTSDCGTDGLVCLNGLCQEDAGSCNGDNGCRSDQRCLDEVCQPREDLCQFNYECADAICVNGACLATCSGEESCAVGQACNSDRGRCEVLAPPTGDCEMDADCGEGGLCIDSACFDACANDEVCGDARYCREGVCVPDTRPTPFCSNDGECNGGPCVGGVCRTTCEDTNECRRADNQFTQCEDAYCITNNEFTSDCEITADCGDPAKSCIDGICRNDAS